MTDSKTDDDIIRRAEMQAAVRKAAVSALDDMTARLKPEAFAELILKDLSKRRNAVMERILGIDTSWSDVRLARDGAIPEAIKDFTSKAASTWVRALVNEEMEANKEVFEKKLRTAIRKYIREDLSYDMYTTARDDIRSQLRDTVKSACSEVVAEITANNTTINTGE